MRSYSLTNAHTVSDISSSYDPLSSFPSRGTSNVVSGICHFTIAASTACFPFVYGTSAGARAAGTPVAGRVGIETLSVTGGAGNVVVYMTPPAIVFGSGVNRFRCDILQATASDGINTYTSRFGFNDSSTTTGDGTDGAFFRYTHSVNGGRWECVTRSNSVETATDSGVSGISAAYQCLEIEVNAAGTSVVFYVNGTLVATNTTNIPTGTARATSVTAQLVKSAGVGTNGFEIDLMAIHCESTTPY